MAMSNSLGMFPIPRRYRDRSKAGGSIGNQLAFVHDESCPHATNRHIPIGRESRQIVGLKGQI
jgi:hypothetical protein